MIRTLIFTLLLLAHSAFAQVLLRAGTRDSLYFVQKLTNAPYGITITGWGTISEGSSVDMMVSSPHNTAPGYFNYGVAVTTNLIRFALEISTIGGVRVTKGGQYELGKRYFVAATHDNNWTQLYMDGVLIAESNNVGPYAYIGDRPDGGTHIGRYGLASVVQRNQTHEDIRLYTRALSASEIKSIYETPWALADDPALVLRTCVASGDTGATLSGVARNYGSWASGSYSNAPVATSFKTPFEPPLTEDTP